MREQEPKGGQPEMKQQLPMDVTLEDIRRGNEHAVAEQIAALERLRSDPRGHGYTQEQADRPANFFADAEVTADDAEYKAAWEGWEKVDAVKATIAELNAKTEQALLSTQIKKREVLMQLVAGADYKVGPHDFDPWAPLDFESTPVQEKEKNKPISRAAAQDAELLAKLRELGYVPLALPPYRPGASGAKAAVKAALGNKGMWAGDTVFKKAWARLTQAKAIRYAP